MLAKGTCGLILQLCGANSWRPWMCHCWVQCVHSSFFGSYSIDVMASCIFSVDFDSIKNPSNPFITHANQMFKFSILLYIFQGTASVLFWVFFVLLLTALFGNQTFWPIFSFSACFPIFLPLLECLGVSLFPKSSTAFLKSVAEKVKAERISSSQVWTNTSSVSS